MLFITALFTLQHYEIEQYPLEVARCIKIVGPLKVTNIHEGIKAPLVPKENEMGKRKNLHLKMPFSNPQILLLAYHSSEPTDKFVNVQILLCKTLYFALSFT